MRVFFGEARVGFHQGSGGLAYPPGPRISLFRYDQGEVMP